MDPGEECDDGSNNSDSAPDACRENCLLPGCGDGVLDTGEACDDGNVDEGDGCSSTCVVFPQPIDDNAWQCFEEDFNSCEDPCLPVVCSCSEDDSIDTCNGAETGGCVDAACVHLYSGGSGYCGLGGVHQTVTVPDAPGVILYAQVRTECDSHAGDALLIVNDGAQRHTLVAYHRVDVNWEEVTIDMTPWAGQTVRLEVAIQETNDRWCDASDRSIRFKVDLLEFRQQ